MTTSRPIKYVYLETTNHCNLDCVFCNRRDVVNSSNLKHMTIEQWKYCMKKLRGEPIEQAKLMGLGEPFFHPQFDSITQIFKAEFPSCFTISATNLQYKVGDRFFQAVENLDLLYFSIDGYKDSYEQARPGSKWDRLISSLNTIEDHYTKINMKRKPRFEVNFVATADTIDSLDKVVDIVKDYNVIDDIRINVAQWWGEEAEICLSETNTIIKKLRNYSDKVKGKAPWDFEDCWWPREGIYMTVNGDLKICCMNTSTESIGNIFLDDLSKLRSTGKLYDTLIALENNDQEINHCRNCSYKTLSPILSKILKST